MNNQDTQWREENILYSTPELILIEVKSEQGFATSSEDFGDSDYPALG